MAASFKPTTVTISSGKVSTINEPADVSYSRFIQDLFKIYSRFIQDLFKICSRFVQDLFKIHSRFIQRA